MANYTFRPRAELLLQLGEQLIKNESIALIELIKNSYEFSIIVCFEAIPRPTPASMYVASAHK